MLSYVIIQIFAIHVMQAMHILRYICSRNYQIIFSDILYICALFLGATWYTYSLLFLFLRCGRSPYSTSYTTLESIILRLWVVLTNLLFFYLSLRAHIASWAFKSHAQSKYCIRTIIDRSSIYSLKRRGWPSSVMVSL